LVFRDASGKIVARINIQTIKTMQDSAQIVEVQEALHDKQEVLEDGKPVFLLCFICAVRNTVSTIKALLQVGCDGPVPVTPELRFPTSRSVGENGL
jgi:hypothetical protein